MEVGSLEHCKSTYVSLRASLRLEIDVCNPSLPQSTSASGAKASLQSVSVAEDLSLPSMSRALVDPFRGRHGRLIPPKEQAAPAPDTTEVESGSFRRKNGALTSRRSGVGPLPDISKRHGRRNALGEGAIGTE